MTTFSYEVPGLGMDMRRWLGFARMLADVVTWQFYTYTPADAEAFVAHTAPLIEGPGFTREWNRSAAAASEVQEVDTSPWSYLLYKNARCWHAPATCTFDEATEHTARFLREHPTFNLHESNCEVFACWMASQCTASSSRACNVQRCARELSYGDVPAALQRPCGLSAARWTQSFLAAVSKGRTRTTATATNNAGLQAD